MRRLLGPLLALASLSGQAQSLSFALEVRATDPQLRGLDVLDLAVDRDGHWWMATLDEGVVRYDGDALHRAEFSGVPPIVLAVAPADGGAFAATSEGLRFVGLNGTAEPVSGMSEPTVDVDAHGDTVWALRADGLALRLPGQSFVPVPGLDLRGATQFGRRGATWWVCSERGLWVRGRSGIWTLATDQPVRSAAIDSEGLWAVTDSGLARLGSQGWTRIAAVRASEWRWVPAEKSSAWWAVTPDGLFWVDGDAPRPLYALNGSPLDRARTLALDGNGGLLLPQADGVLRIPRPEQWYDVRTASFNVGRITSVAHLGPDSLAILGSRGLQLLGPKSRTAIPLPRGGVATGLLELGRGRWLLYGEFGALRWTGRAWKSEVREWVLSAGWTDQPVLETTSGWLAWNGSKWAATAVPDSVQVPRRWAESGYEWVWSDRGIWVSAPGRAVAVAPSARWVLRSWDLSEGSRGTNVVLRLLRHGEPGAERRPLRYRLNQGPWVDLGVARTLALSGLPTGTHTVELSGRQFFTVRIPRPWWGQPRFWVPLLALLLLAGSALSWVALRRRREARKWAGEKAELERMALRLQMNPHFTFNALESISSFVMEQKPREAVQYLNQFAKLMRYTLEKAEQERVPLGDEVAALGHYIALEQMRFDQSFDYVLEVDEALDPAELTIPPMLLQPVVENAILHGLRPLEGRRGVLTVRVLQAVAPDRIRVEIQDNGIGRAAASAKRTGDEGQKRSMATRILANRLKALSESTGSSFSLDVEDLDEGTRVVLALPKDEVWGS
ncbi:MAG: histidine kinase [Schleiferiaceae bacterium]